MGDRCYMVVNCRRQDAPKFEELGFRIEDVYAPGEPGDPVMMVDDEANYAHYQKMPEDIPYEGWHDAGGDYGCEVFACDGKKVHYADCNKDQSVVVTVNEDCFMCEASLTRAREYYKAYKFAQEIL